MSSALTQQRCFHHPAREAVARCLTCRNYYCRECVTEHQGRVVCAGCLRAFTPSPVKPRSRSLGWLLPAGGFLFAWWCFYLLGRLLASLPADVWGDA